MRYELYTTVDITSTGQYRPGSDRAYKSEQNFQTVLQTIGLRANISYSKLPKSSTISGRILGFNTPEIIKVWSFEFETERDFLFQLEDNPIGYLIKDFEGVPYISGLDESMTQNYDVFATEGAARNIVFQIKE